MIVLLNRLFHSLRKPVPSLSVGQPSVRLEFRIQPSSLPEKLSAEHGRKLPRITQANQRAPNPATGELSIEPVPFEEWSNPIRGDLLVEKRVFHFQSSRLRQSERDGGRSCGGNATLGSPTLQVTPSGVRPFINCVCCYKQVTPDGVRSRSYGFQPGLRGHEPARWASWARPRLKPELQTGLQRGRLKPELLTTVVLILASFLVACGPKSAAPGAEAAADPHLATNGTVEVTAKLLEVPEGAIFKRDLYDYATVLKYQVLQVHRGKVAGETIYVGHYNPWKPRNEAADARVKTIGGNLRRFQAGQVHRLALEVPIEDYFMGGIVNKYFGKTSGPIYWAVWTSLVSE